MTASFASDQNVNMEGLSATAKRMIAVRDAVLAEWERRVRATLPQAGALRHPILIDTLPSFYDNLAQAISAGYPRASVADGSSVATEHGGERARLTAYDLNSLIGEYQQFRWAVVQVLQREGIVLSHDEQAAMNAAIDAGIKEAATGFTMVHAALRERFVATLTHDMRNPLAVAVTALELCQVSADPEQVKSATLKALQHLRRMDDMIDELLNSMACAGGQSVHIQPTEFDIRELIDEVQADAVAMHGARVVVDGEPARGWWGRAELTRALENMVSNAFKYGHPDGVVTIHTAAGHGRLMLSVHNEGEPIPAVEQECIFQMYRRAEAARRNESKGWGIGLPYVRAVAEAHGGSVTLDSGAGRGTTFIIDMPLDARPLANAPSLS